MLALSQSVADGVDHLVADGVDRGLESADVVVVERAAGVVAGTVQRHAGLVGIAEKIQAFEIHLLCAIRCDCLRAAAV